MTKGRHYGPRISRTRNDPIRSVSNLRGAQSRNRGRVRSLRESDAAGWGTSQHAKGNHAADSTSYLLQLRQGVAAQEQVLWLLRDSSACGTARAAACRRSASTCGASAAACSCSTRGGTDPSARGGSTALSPCCGYPVDQRAGSSASTSAARDGADTAQTTRSRSTAGPASDGSTA